MSFDNLLNLDIATYYVIFFILYMLSIYSFIKKNVFLDVFVFFAITFFSFIFYTCLKKYGVDTYTYLNEFHHLSSYNDFQYGPSMYCLILLIKSISNADEVYVSITTGLLLLVTVLTISKFVQNNIRSLCLAFFVLSFTFFELNTNVYRQGMASVLMMLSYKFFIQKKYKYSTCCGLISMGFHWTSLLIFLFIFISGFLSRKINLVRSFVILVLVLNIIAVLSAGSLMPKLSEIGMSTGFLMINNISIVDKYNLYTNGTSNSLIFSEVNLSGRINFILDITIGLFFSLFLLSKKNNPDEDIVKHISFFSLLSFYNVVLINMNWFVRNSYWAFIIIPYIYVYMVVSISKNKTKYNVLLYYMFFSIFFLYSTLSLWRHPNLITDQISFPIY